MLRKEGETNPWVLERRGEGRISSNTQFAPNRLPHESQPGKKRAEVLKEWDSKSIYSEISQRSQGRTKYILHDGPRMRTAISTLERFEQNTEGLHRQVKIHDRLRQPVCSGWTAMGSRRA